MCHLKKVIRIFKPLNHYTKDLNTMKHTNCLSENGLENKLCWLPAYQWSCGWYKWKTNKAVQRQHETAGDTFTLKHNQKLRWRHFSMWLKDLSILPLSDYGIVPSTGNLNLNNNLDKIKVITGYSWVRYIHSVASFCTHCTYSALIVG